MNWQPLFGYSGTADWILLTAFHSLWLSLAAFLIIHIRRFRAPAVRSTWCTFAIVLLLILPLITWFIPRAVVRAHLDQKASIAMSAATAASKLPFLNSVLNVQAPSPQARINKWKVPMNQFGFLWLAVTLGCLARLLYQLAFLKGYCHGLQNIEDDRISAILQEINESFAFRKKPRLFVSPRLTSPISMGIKAPLVVLPASLYQSISDGELRAILLHELAHIYHYDHVLGLLQRLVKALYWWNPLVYRLSNALSIAREEVSDNYAISGMESAAGYATLLVSLIEKTSLISRMPCTAAMATPYESLKTRIQNIVSKERDMRVKTDKGMVSAVVATAVLLCGLVGVGSQVKVFGVGQASSSGKAKPIVVSVKNLDANFDMGPLHGSVLTLEAVDNSKYQSTPILINGNQGNCDFPDAIPPGHYMLLSAFTYRRDVDIPPTPHEAATLHITISAGGRIAIGADFILRNEDAAAPQTAPVQLDPSQTPVILSRVELEYPPDAKLAKISGTVKVEAIVNEKGEVYEGRLLMGHPWFQKPGLDAVLQWKFQPMLVNGQPKPFVTTVDLPFHN